jgi:hypothetical protein
VEETRRAESAVETAAAVEIDEGGLRRLLDNFHKLLGKASAKKRSGFPTVTTAPAASFF